VSEPDGAFLKLQIDRADLVAWLTDPPPSASAWRDWRSIGGEYYFGEDEHRPLAEFTDAEMGEILAQCDKQLIGYPSNRDALRDRLVSTDEPFLTRIAYDPDRREFIAGVLAYSDNLYDLIVFLAVARGAARRLKPDGHGAVVVHNYIFIDAKETTTALRLGPGDRSDFMAPADFASAAGVFQPIADEVLKGEPFPPARNELGTLK
jgi:hypothetical protein